MSIKRSSRRIAVGCRRAVVALATSAALYVSFGSIAAAAGGGEISWVEDFADDPIIAGRFSVPPNQDPTRFSYSAISQQLTIQYDTFLTTAWYLRPLDVVGSRSFGRCDDFEFAVTFRMRSAGFFADLGHFAQIGWALINAQTTGEDRAGGSAGPFAFDLVAFDFFPNVTAFGGPNMGPTVIHSDDGAGFFANIDFAFGPETQIDTAIGDEAIALDTVYTARVTYSAANQVATLTIHDGSRFLAIDADGAGGPGGFDNDVSTIQTFLQIVGPFEVDTFALTAWQDTFNPFNSTVRADVDVLNIAFWGTVQTEGDFNYDGLVDGKDIAPFVEALLSATPDPCLASRGDFNLDGQLTVEDIPGFLTVLLGA